MKRIIPIAVLTIPVFILVFCSGSVSVDDHNNKTIAGDYGQSLPAFQ
ncbi:MAG TPA: hypothetical protein VIM07_10505 [Chitinophagaceae bacterium]